MEGIENSVYAKRVSISFLVLVLIVSLLLIYFGMFGHIQAVLFRIGLEMSRIGIPILLYLWHTENYEIIFRSLINGTTRIYQVLTGQLRKRRTVNAHARLRIPLDNAMPVVDYPITQPPVALEPTDESSSDKTTVKNTPQAETETLITWLAQNRTGVSSVPLSEKVRHGQSLPLESWMPRQMGRADLSSCDHKMRPVQNAKTPLLQQPPQQGQYSQLDSLQMPLNPEIPRQEISVQSQFSLVSQRQIVPDVHVSPLKEKQVQYQVHDQQNSLRQRRKYQESLNLPTQTRI